MKFDLDQAISVLERTPAVLSELLMGLDEAWTSPNEGPDTWSPFDVVGHLLHGEATDWMPRIKLILSDAQDKTFKPFDRFAQKESSKGKTLNDLLTAFSDYRTKNLAELKSLNLTERDLERTGVHPALGPVVLHQVLATWVAHDLGHIVQVSRVMAKQYTDQVGPWTQYLKVLNT